MALKLDFISGPFEAKVGDWTQASDGAVFFAVRLNVGGRSRTVLRRFREFAALHRELRQQNRSLPWLPPRSLFRKALLPGFMERRRRGLQSFLAAALAADPHCHESSALRAFLALPPAAPSSDGGSTRLSTFRSSVADTELCNSRAS